MTSMDDFEKSLKEVVSAKRLSASKMNALTDNTMKLLQHDTQLISILYRTHKAMSSASKVSSLYVIDAICRAARHHVNKHNLHPDSHSGKGNAASFLSKFEAVLDGVFLDMLQTGGPEGKEKAKKIVDIWTKGNTFPSHVLSRLSDMIQDPDKDLNGKSHDPRVAQQPSIPATSLAITGSPPSASPSTPTPTTALTDAQSTLLTLLTQAASGHIANVNGGQSAQLAMLQQLKAAQTPQMNVVPPIPTAQSTSLPPQQAHGQNSSISPPGTSRDYTREDHRDRRNVPRYQDEYDQYDQPGPSSGRGRGGYRGGYRGGRGRGRGGQDPRGRWDDRYRDNDRESPGAGRKRSSRSRSPPHPSSRFGRQVRDANPYSPPHRPPMVSPPPTQSTTWSEDPRKKASSGDTDEFGRVLRVASDGPPNSPPSTVTPEPASKDEQQTELEEKAPEQYEAPSAGDELHNANKMDDADDASVGAGALPSGTAAEGGLETFDVSTFDPTSPASWLALGELWRITNGSPPTTDQLMQFVMLVNSGSSPAQIVAQARVAWQQWASAEWQAGGGGGNVGYEDSSGQYGGYSSGSWQAGGIPNSDGFGGNGANGGGGAHGAGGNDVLSKSSIQKSGTSSGGSMQKVGDKWVFVRSAGGPTMS